MHNLERMNVQDSMKTRKIRGGMFGAFTSGLARAAPRATSAMGRSGSHAATSFGRRPQLSLASLLGQNSRRLMSGKSQSLFGTATYGKKKPEGKKVPVYTKVENLKENPTVQQLQSLHTSSLPRAWKKLLPDENVPLDKSRNEFISLLTNSLKQKGRIQELTSTAAAAAPPAAPVANQATGASTGLAHFGNAAAAGVAPPTTVTRGALELLKHSNQHHIKEGAKLVEFLQPATETSIASAAKEVRKFIAEESPLLPAQIDIEARNILTTGGLDVSRLVRLKASELLYWQPISNLALHLGKRTPLFKPTGMFRRILLPESLMFSSRNLTRLQGNPTLKSIPTQEGFTQINQDLFDILRYKLSNELNFNVRNFKGIFTPESIVILKMGIVRAYLEINQDFAKKLFSTFLVCANEGLLTTATYKSFLTNLENNPEEAFKQLNDLIKAEAETEQQVRRQRQTSRAGSEGWHKQKYFQQFLAASGVAAILLLLGFAGVNTGFPIIDNIIFNLITLGKLQYGVKDTKDKVTNSELGVLGTIVDDVIVKPILQKAQEQGKTLIEAKEAAQEKYKEVTAPYRPKPWYESIGNTFGTFTRKNKKLSPIAEINESKVSNND